MKVYLYDEDTKEYIQEEEALLDPLESKVQKKNIYLIPANVTTKEPLPAKEGYAVIFKNDDWAYTPDNRGKKAINKERGVFNIDYVGINSEDTLITEEIQSKIDSGELVIQDNQIVEKTKEMKEQEVRHIRDAYLSLTDRYMLPDFPIEENKRENYAEYRKYLRNIPENEAFPNLTVLTFDEWSALNA